jgi:hypothetical protein
MPIKNRIDDFSESSITLSLKLAGTLVKTKVTNAMNAAALMVMVTGKYNVQRKMLLT